MRDLLINNAHYVSAEAFKDVIMRYGLAYHRILIRFPPESSGIPACHSSSSEAGRLKFSSTHAKRSCLPTCPPKCKRRRKCPSAHRQAWVIFEFGKSSYEHPCH